MLSVGPQRYADNLKSSSVCPRAFFGAARFTVQYVRAVGQDVSPDECVLFGTSEDSASVHEAVRWEALVC